jgi:hypothetical protein
MDKGITSIRRPNIGTKNFQLTPKNILWNILFKNGSRSTFFIIGTIFLLLEEFAN